MNVIICLDAQARKSEQLYSFTLLSGNGAEHRGGPVLGPAAHLDNLLELFNGLLLQLSDLSHGFIKAAHLGRQFLFFLGKLKGETQEYGPVPISASHVSVLLCPILPLTLFMIRDS